MRSEITAAILLGIGVAAFAGAYLVHREQTAHMVVAPESSGEVGSVAVYYQTPNGPVRLQPNRPRVIERPQAIAFQLTAQGTGPRMVRIEVEAGGKRLVMHEQKLAAPASSEMVDYVIDLGDDMPDDVAIIVAIEAPHTMGYESRYPLRLTGSAKKPAP